MVRDLRSSSRFLTCPKAVLREPLFACCCSLCSSCSREVLSLWRRQVDFGIQGFGYRMPAEEGLLPLLVLLYNAAAVSRLCLLI